MNLLKIKYIDKDFEIEQGKIYSLDIESQNLFIRLANAIIDADNDYLKYSEDYKCEKFEKKSILITDLFALDPNSKKILASLYKRIDSNIISNSDKEEIEKINTQLLNILNKISLELNTEMQYLLDLDITKILSLYKFEFSLSNGTLIERLLSYIKAHMEIMDLKFVITFNILPLIPDDDFNTFQHEFEVLGLSLININFVSKFKSKGVEYLTIDKDLCEF